MNTTRRTSILLVLFAVALVSAIAADLRETLQSFKSSAGLDSAYTSLLLIDLKSGDRILEHNASLPLIPASITKCVTTATFLEKVGSKFRFETPVYYTGHLAGGVIGGDLVVEASGDPSLNTVREPGSSDIVAEIVEALRSLHVHEIQGNILIDEDNFPVLQSTRHGRKGTCLMHTAPALMVSISRTMHQANVRCPIRVRFSSPGFVRRWQMPGSRQALRRGSGRQTPSSRRTSFGAD